MIPPLKAQKNGKGAAKERRRKRQSREGTIRGVPYKRRNRLAAAQNRVLGVGKE